MIKSGFALLLGCFELVLKWKCTWHQKNLLYTLKLGPLSKESANFLTKLCYWRDHDLYLICSQRQNFLRESPHVCRHHETEREGRVCPAPAPPLRPIIPFLDFAFNFRNRPPFSKRDRNCSTLDHVLLPEEQTEEALTPAVQD